MTRRGRGWIGIGMGSLLLAMLTLGTGEGGEKAKITYWRVSHPIEGAAAKTLAKNFMEKYPNIEVDVQMFPVAEYEQKIRTAIAGGVAPDIIAIDGPTIAAYAYQGAIIPLDDFYAKDSRDDILDATLREITWRGRIWAGPLQQSSIAVWYNKAMFDQEGIKPPRDVDKAWTWAEFLDVAQRMTKRNPDGSVKIWGLKLALGFSEWAAYSEMPWLWQNGADILSPDGTKSDGFLNGPAAVEALSFWGDLFTKHKVVPQSPLVTGSVVSQEPLAVGQVAMIIAGTAPQAFYQQKFPSFQYGVTPLPRNKAQVTPCGSWHMAITAQAKHPKEAWLFVDWVTGKSGTKYWYETTRYLPTRKSVYDAHADLGQYPTNIFSEQTKRFCRPRPITPAYPVISDAVIQAFQDTAFGKDPKASLDLAVRTIDRELRKYPVR